MTDTRASRGAELLEVARKKTATVAALKARHPDMQPDYDLPMGEWWLIHDLLAEVTRLQEELRLKTNHDAAAYDAMVIYKARAEAAEGALREVQAELQQMKGGIESTLSFLDTVDWQDHTAEDHAENLTNELDQLLAALRGGDPRRQQDEP